MALQTPVDREFAILARGFIRDRVILANFREGLRGLTNPATGTPFTEEEIRRATQPKTRWYNEAQGVDDYGQAEQRRALFMADQLRIERASTKWLVDFHGNMWGEGFLEPTGGSGAVTVTGVPGTGVVGSTTLNDPTAHKARDAAGNSFQVLVGGAIEPSGELEVTMISLGTGKATNPAAGDLLTWTFRDPNMEAQATVLVSFSGGTNRETDAEFASRLAAIIRHKQGAGNDSQTRAWTRKASNAIEDAFVYPCAFHAGSVMIAITQKRANVVGPLARVPSAGTLAAAIAYMTPPASAVYPTPPHVLVVGVQTQSSDLVLRLEMARGSLAGWTDVRPFPAFHATTPAISSVASNTDFQITCPADATLPNALPFTTLSGDNVPRLMVWDAAKSTFFRFKPTSVQDLGANVYRVLLPGPIFGFTPTIGQVVSADVGRQGTIAKALEQYFDELGPREVVDLATDARGGRCIRFPPTAEERPYRAGAIAVTRVLEALGGTSADGELASISRTEPDLPTTLTNGPNMLVLGKVGLYPI